MKTVICFFLFFLFLKLNVYAQTYEAHRNIKYSFFCNILNDSDSIIVDVLLTLTDTAHNDTTKYVFYYFEPPKWLNNSDNTNYIYNDLRSIACRNIAKGKKDYNEYPFVERICGLSKIKYKILKPDSTLFVRTTYKMYFDKKKRLSLVYVYI